VSQPRTYRCIAVNRRFGPTAEVWPGLITNLERRWLLDRQIGRIGAAKNGGLVGLSAK
jgi:hypothetical protein